MAASFVQKGLKDPGVRWIGAGWTAFILENLVLSENRQYIIDYFGDDNYHLAYSSLSTLACGSILYGYVRYGRGKGLPLSPPGPIRNALSFTFRSLGLIGLSQQIPLLRMPYTYESTNSPVVEDVPTPVTLSPVKKWRCPMEFGAHHGGAEDGIKGMERISRHSTFWSFGLIGIGAAVRSPFLPEVVMFSFPSIFALIGGAHQDHRFLKNSGGKLSVEKYNATSNVPFLAIATGKQNLADVWSEMKLPNLGIALCTSMLVSLRHMKR